MPSVNVYVTEDLKERLEGAELNLSVIARAAWEKELEMAQMAKDAKEIERGPGRGGTPIRGHLDRALVVRRQRAVPHRRRPARHGRGGEVLDGPRGPTSIPRTSTVGSPATRRRPTPPRAALKFKKMTGLLDEAVRMQHPVYGPPCFFVEQESPGPGALSCSCGVRREDGVHSCAVPPPSRRQLPGWRSASRPALPDGWVSSRTPVGASLTLSHEGRARRARFERSRGCVARA